MPSDGAAMERRLSELALSLVVHWPTLVRRKKSRADLPSSKLENRANDDDSNNGGIAAKSHFIALTSRDGGRTTKQTSYISATLAKIYTGAQASVSP